MIATSVFRLIYFFRSLSVRRIFVCWSLLRFKTSGLYLGYFLTSPPLSLWTSYMKAPCPFRRRCRASRVQIPWRKALHSSLSPSFAIRSLRPTARARCCCSAESARFSAASAGRLRPARHGINYVASDTEYRRPNSQTLRKTQVSVSLIGS